MTKKTPKELSQISTEALLSELARRQQPDFTKIRKAEEALDQQGKAFSRGQFKNWLRTLECEEISTSKPCPKCGRLVKVNVAKRPRTLHTLHGEITYRRNYHFCSFCSAGFYPLDDALELRS